VGVDSARAIPRGGSGPLSTAITQFLDQYFTRHPVNATFTGLHAHDDRLPEWSREAREDELDEFEALTVALDDVHAPDANDAVLASDVHALDAELARANMDIRQLEFESRFFHDRNPALWTGEALFGVIGLMLRPPAPLADALGSIAMRLYDTPRFLREMQDTVTDPVPAAWAARALREAETAAALCERALPAWLREQEADAAAWLRLLPDGGEAALSIGEEAYAVLLTRGHFELTAPADLLAQAMQEMPEAQERLTALAASVAGTLDDLSAALADDCATPASYLSAYETKWQSCRAFAEEHDLVEWGDWPLRYVPQPLWAREIAPALYFLFYRSPSPYALPAVHDYLVTPVDDTIAPAEQERRLRLWNHSAITLNHVVHHGALGHHVQNWHASQRSRSQLGAIAAVDCASRIGMFQGGSMAEGWACYATELADELGFLTPLEQAAQQQSRVRMLARAIVDIQLHCGQLSFEDAVTYYVTEVGMTRAAAEGEATKNSMFPGTAVMYWLGTRGILQLREEQMASEGAGFSLRAFHDGLLSRGAIPVALAARLMRAESA
jgi:hypothetical protein